MEGKSMVTNSYFSGAGLMDLGLAGDGLVLQQSSVNSRHEVVRSDIPLKLVDAQRPRVLWWLHSRAPDTRRSPTFIGLERATNCSSISFVT